MIDVDFYNNLVLFIWIKKIFLFYILANVLQISNFDKFCYEFNFNFLLHFVFFHTSPHLRAPRPQDPLYLRHLAPLVTMVHVD